MFEKKPAEVCRGKKPGCLDCSVSEMEACIIVSVTDTGSIFLDSRAICIACWH